MKLKQQCLFALAAIATGGLSQIPASTFSNSVGLPGLGLNPIYAIDFDRAGFAKNSPIANQFAGLGVSFSMPLFYDGNEGGCGCNLNNESGDCLTTFTSYAGARSVTDTQRMPFSILFAVPQTSAAFALVTDNDRSLAGNTIIQAYRDNTLIDTFIATTGENIAGNYYGFYGEPVFDRILITTSGRHLAALDNLQLSAAVPEPGTLGLLALGLAGAATLARRRLFRVA